MALEIGPAVYTLRTADGRIDTVEVTEWTESPTLTWRPDGGAVVVSDKGPRVLLDAARPGERRQLKRPMAWVGQRELTADGGQVFVDGKPLGEDQGGEVSLWQRGTTVFGEVRLPPERFRLLAVQSDDIQVLAEDADRVVTPSDGACARAPGGDWSCWDANLQVSTLPGDADFVDRISPPFTSLYHKGQSASLELRFPSGASVDVIGVPTLEQVCVSSDLFRLYRSEGWYDVTPSGISDLHPF